MMSPMSRPIRLLASVAMVIMMTSPVSRPIRSLKHDVTSIAMVTMMMSPMSHDPSRPIRSLKNEEEYQFVGVLILLSTIRRSGHYNTTDLIQTPPETRWANEGFHSGQGKKRVVYDDLSLIQWAVGQLSNVYQMKDATVSKQALLQVILALKDATSLPWQAVRSAWATSMHEIEDGSLTWVDATHWSLNRLSASQIAMADASIVSNGASQQLHQKKTCKFFNEGTCSHDLHHGNFKHFCAFCSRQGRYSVHPEVKYNFKVRTLDKSDK